MIDSAFWRGRRVFVTGHTGFKGSWLVQMLSRLSAHCIGFALAPPTEPNLFTLAGVADSLTDLRGDIRDFDALKQAICDAEPEIVIHMAAQPLVRRSYTDPLSTYAVNVLGVANLLEAVRETPTVRAVINVTTDKCYDNREWAWGYRESDRLGGHDPYSSSKACAELVTSAYRASFFGDSRATIATARAGNVVGGGDFAADRILPDAFRAFSAGRQLNVRYPAAVRPWQHVLEPLSGYLMLAQQAFLHGKRFGEGWNFGPGPDSERDVESLLERFTAVWGPGASWNRDRSTHPHEAGLLRLDATNAREKLGWRPLLDFDCTIDWTAQWYRAFARGADMRAETMAQVNSYLGRRVRLTSPFGKPISCVNDEDGQNAA